MLTTRLLYGRRPGALPHSAPERTRDPGTRPGGPPLPAACLRRAVKRALVPAAIARCRSSGLRRAWSPRTATLTGCSQRRKAAMGPTRRCPNKSPRSRVRASGDARRDHRKGAHTRQRAGRTLGPGVRGGAGPSTLEAGAKRVWRGRGWSRSGSRPARDLQTRASDGKRGCRPTARARHKRASEGKLRADGSGEETDAGIRGWRQPRQGPETRPNAGGRRPGASVRSCDRVVAGRNHGQHGAASVPMFRLRSS